MTELSTADLAGGAPTRPQPATQSPPRDPQTDRDFDRMDGAEDEFDRRDSTMTDRPTEMAGQRPSTLPNPAATDGADHPGAEPLFPTAEAQSFRNRWTEAQTGFVDDPRTAVEQADSMVAEMMQRLAQVFAEERAKLEEQWSRGDDISTEDLRQALRRYRSFFDRLLNV